MAARPYPYDRWPRMSRRDVACVRGALSAMPDAAACAAAAAEATSLLGTRWAVRGSGVEVWPAAKARAELAAPLCALWLERAEGPHTLPVVCELPIELAATLVDRVLGGDGAAAQPIGAAPDDVSAGVLAYLGARLCAALDAGVRVRAALADAQRAHALLEDENVLVCALEVECDGVARGRVRLWTAQRAAERLTPRRARTAAHVPAAWRDLSLTLCAHAGAATLAAREWSALGAGDVVIPDRCSLARDANGGFAGAIALHAMGAHAGGRRWRGRAEGRAVRVESLEPLHLSQEDTPMTDPKRIETQALRNDVTPFGGDVPIEVCLEIARFTLPLDALSALCEGDVLDTGSAIGSRVSLSAGGRAIARGELVDVEGAVGVRILELLR
jgi:type III secretion system YscQ/HrcQ family protein